MVLQKDPAVFLTLSSETLYACNFIVTCRLRVSTCFKVYQVVSPFATKSYTESYNSMDLKSLLLRFDLRFDLVNALDNVLDLRLHPHNRLLD